MTSLYDRVADLPVRIDDYEIEPLSRPGLQWTRYTTVFHLSGGGQEGIGEDVCWGPEDQQRQREAGASLELAGEWTIRTFSAHLDEIDTFYGFDPTFPEYRLYRRWALESAALDLALRQAGQPLHAVLGREPRPLNFAVSLRLGDPPSLAGVEQREAAYPGTRYKLDGEPSWDQGFIAAVAAAGTADVIDFKGAYKGTPVDVDTDPVLYRRVAEALPDAWLEDPDLTVPEAREALAPFMDRVTWDAPIHSVDDVLALDHRPSTLNSKPSRFGSLETLFGFYEFCEREEIALYGGGQAELGCGRGQVQLLAAMFHPDGPNDVAPKGWDQDDFARTGLATSPLDPSPDATGFRRA